MQKLDKKWPTLSRRYRGKIQSYRTKTFLFKSILSFLSIHGMLLTINTILNFLRFFKNYHQAHFLKWVKNEQLQRQKTHLGMYDT